MIAPLRPIPRSYRHLALLILLMTLVAAATGVIFLRSVEQRLVETAGEALTLAAVDIADKLDLRFAERYGDLRLMTQAEPLRSRDADAMTRFLHLVQETHPVYLWLGVTDAQGRIIAATFPGSIGKDRGGGKDFTAAATGDAIYVQDPKPSREIPSTSAVGFAVAWKGPEGQLAGALLAEVAFSSIEDIFARTGLSLQAQQGAPETVEYQLLAQDGTVLIDSLLREASPVNLRQRGLPSALLVGSSPPGYVEEQHLRRQVPVITGYARTRGNGDPAYPSWGILVRRDRSKVLAPTWATAWRQGAAGTALFVPMWGLLIWLIGRLQKEWVAVQQEHTRALAAEEALQARSAKLQLLVEAARQFTTEPDLPRLLQNLTDIARQMTGARYAALGVFDPAGTRLVQFVTSGLDEATRQAIGSPPIGRGLLGHLGGDVLNLSDLSQHPAFTGFPPNYPMMHSFLGIPIRVHGRLYGCLYLTDKEGPEGERADFTKLDEQMIAALSAQAGAAIENSTLLNDSRQAESNLRLLLQATEEGIYGIDESCTCRFINNAAAAMFGYEPDELIGRDIHALIHHHDAQGRPYPIEACPISPQAIHTGTACHVEDEMFWRRDGTAFPVEYTSNPIKERDRVLGAVAVFTDITKRKQLEEQLRHSQKMEGIGRLAGGIAHDFNNLLTVINGYSRLLLDSLTPEAPMWSALEEINKAGRHAASLTSQLLAFSRRQVLDPRILDLNLVVNELERMLRRLIGEDITLQLSLAPAPGQVKADPGQVEQVIVNLAVNARDAMPRGGTLTIETANVELDENFARVHPGVSPGPYVLLALSDTGCGMDAATQARLFEPFFTTKELGKGTGLGLSTSYGIVKQSGGHIAVYSEVGRGTTFTIYLPRILGEVTHKAKPSPQPLPLGSETILLAEDEEMVRIFTKAVLESQGYTVLEARDGSQALELARQHGGPIHLLVTDVVMPGMSGRALAERLAQAHPDTTVLYLSGYTDNTIVPHGVLDEGTAFLQKPFTPHALALKVREVLDTPRRR